MDIIISQILASVETIGYSLGMLIAYLSIVFAVVATVVKIWRKFAKNKTKQNIKDISQANQQ